MTTAAADWGGSDRWLQAPIRALLPVRTADLALSLVAAIGFGQWFGGSGEDPYLLASLSEKRPMSQVFTASLMLSTLSRRVRWDADSTQALLVRVAQVFGIVLVVIVAERLATLTWQLFPNPNTVMVEPPPLRTGTASGTELIQGNYGDVASLHLFGEIKSEPEAPQGSGQGPGGCARNQIAAYPPRGVSYARHQLG